MNNFNFYVLGNYSPNIRTFGKYKSTCYRLVGFSREILLDFGAGVFLKFLRIIKKEKIDINNILIIISHNHIDHNFSLLFFAIYLYFYNTFHKNKKKVEVILPKKSIIYIFISSLKSVYNVQVLNQETEFNIDECKFSFCKTIHKGESYATKIKYRNKSFVYTSDIARFSEELKKFVSGANTVLIDAGYPIKRYHSFCNYHGRTYDILNEVNTMHIKRILATHIRFFSKYGDYIKRFPKKSNVELVQIDDYYKMFIEQKQ